MTVIRFKDESGVYRPVPYFKGEKGDPGAKGDRGPAGKDGYQKPSGGILITDLESKAQSAISDVQSATYSVVGGSLMKRTSTGAVSVADPTASAHAANRKYVDDAVAAKIQVVSALPASPAADVLYLIPE